MACNVTAKSGQSKGLEDALGSSVKGKLQGRYKRQRVLYHWFRIINASCKFKQLYSISL